MSTDSVEKMNVESNPIAHTQKHKSMQTIYAGGNRDPDQSNI